MGRTRWEHLTGGTSGEEYAARFDALAAGGQDVHGEAAFVTGLVEPGARVLDAGCGTGRVAVRLAALGHPCVGVDVDESMLEVARRTAPDVDWVVGDLSALPPGVVAAAPYDVVVMAGNVVPLLAPGSLSRSVAGLAEALGAGGLLVAGFGLDGLHLPPGCPVTPLEDYLAVAVAAGLEPVELLSSWEAAPYEEGVGYVVTVHRRTSEIRDPGHK